MTYLFAKNWILGASNSDGPVNCNAGRWGVPEFKAFQTAPSHAQVVETNWNIHTNTNPFISKYINICVNANKNKQIHTYMEHCSWHDLAVDIVPQQQKGTYVKKTNIFYLYVYMYSCINEQVNTGKPQKLVHEISLASRMPSRTKHSLPTQKHHLSGNWFAQHSASAMKHLLPVPLSAPSV